MARSDEAKYKLHSDEYMEFVRTNKRFPDLTDTFSTGTKMYNWRRYARDTMKDKNILDFDDTMKMEVESNRSFYKNKLNNKMRYDKLTECDRTEFDPQTYEEYMEGNNRYHYFDLSKYVDIIQRVGNPDKEEIILACRLKLLMQIYNCNFTWKEFHDEYNITQIGRLIMEAVQTLNDRESMVVIMKYGLENGCCVSNSKIAKVFNTSPDRIRCIETKALRKLRWPVTLRKIKSTRRIVNRIAKDHWFLIDMYQSNMCIPREMMIHRPVYEMEEALIALSEECNIDVIDPKSEYKIRSVKTYEKYAYEIGNDLIFEMNIPREDITGNCVYAYTVISVEQVPTISSKEYIETQIELQQQRIAEKEIKKDFEHNVKENMRAQLLDPEFRHKAIKETRDLRFLIDNFESLFSVACSRICATIEFDGEYAWISEFNKKIREYDIPVNCVKDSAEILRRVLCGYIDDFVFSCKYLPKGIHYYYMHIEIVD